MSHFQTKMQQIRFLASVRLSFGVLDRVWHLGTKRIRSILFTCRWATFHSLLAPFRPKNPATFNVTESWTVFLLFTATDDVALWMVSLHDIVSDEIFGSRFVSITIATSVLFESQRSHALHQTAMRCMAPDVSGSAGADWLIKPSLAE